MNQANHVSRVRVLYKYILKLHRALPRDIKAMGDQYVKDEFKRHKTASPELANKFFIEWTGYCATLANQVGDHRFQLRDLGQQLATDKLTDFSNEQIQQLYELLKEATGSKSTDK